METFSTFVMPPIPSPNPSCSSIAQSSEPHSRFDRTQNSRFVCYTTPAIFPLAICRGLPILHAAWTPCVRMSIEAEKEKLTENLTFNLRCHRNDWSVRQWSFGRPRADQDSRKFIRSKLVIIC
jgi:hypothetical protein